MKIRFSISAKLILGIGIIILAILANTYVINNSLHESRKLNKKISNVYVPSTSHLAEMHSAVMQSKGLIKSWVFIEDETNTPEKIKLKKLHNNTFPELHKKISDLSEKWEEKNKKKYEHIYKAINDTLFGMHQEIMTSLDKPEAYNNTGIMSKVRPMVNDGGKVLKLTNNIEDEIDALRDQMQKKVESSRDEMLAIYDQFNSYILLLSIVLVVISAIIAIFLARSTIRPIRKVQQILFSMCQGILPKEKLKVRNDEIGDMSAALNDLVDSFKQFTNFAKEIGEGNYEANFEPLSDQDDLGNALLEMRDNLKKASEEEAKRQEEDKQRNWASQGIAKFSEILRENNDDIDELSFQIIQNLVNYTEANQGGLFLVNDEDEENKFIELKAAYAFNRRKYLEKNIEFGVGLIGRAVQEGETIFMTEIPDNYINITSGLGEANPKSLLIVPLKANDEIHGVIEMASFKEFEQYQIDFVEKIAENIASTLATVKINIRTNELLERTQQQAEEMKSQEEEMRQNMEELKATQEESSRREKELKAKLIDCEQKLKKYTGEEGESDKNKE